MGGWFADIFIEWIVRMVAKSVRRVQNYAWPVVEGVITNAQCQQAHYGCQVADVHFDYAFESVECSSFHEEPFLLHDTGENWARCMRVGSKVPIRVNPKEPSQTVAVLA